MRLFSNMLTFNRVKDGISTYFHVKYSRNENGNPMQDTPATYIGTVVTSDPTPPNDYKKYTWARLEGAQGKDGENGIPGHNGEDGSTSYLHIKYSDDGKTFTSNNGETPGAWIGQYVDFEPYDSPIFSRYTWKKIEGEDGKPGPMPVNAGQWSKDIEYIKDEFVQPYVWQIKNGKKLYYLLVAEKSKGDDPYTNNTQGNGDIWRYREEYDLFLARKIQADEIDVDSIFATRIQTGNLDVTAGATIGGFELGNGRIGAVATPGSEAFGNLALYKDFFRIGGSNGYAMFGDDVIPASVGGAFNAVGRITNKRQNKDDDFSYDRANYGLFIEVDGGTKNYGLHSNAPLIAPSFVNTAVGELDFNDSTYNIDFSQHSIFIMNRSRGDGVTVRMPSEDSVAQHFGMNSLKNGFGFIFTVVAKALTKRIVLENIYNANHNLTNFAFGGGDSATILAHKTGGIFEYQMLTHNT